jgi:hypothetical protein
VIGKAWLDEAQENVKRLHARIPSGQLGVVAVDTFDPPPGDPVLLAVFQTREAADRFIADRKASGSDGFEELHVYEGRGAA